jgi:uncharacterized protein YuzE
MLNSELMIGYDKEADVLYLSFGVPQKGMEYVEVSSNLIVRVHPQTRRVVGITILDFAKRFSAPAALTSLPIAGNFVLEKELVAAG